MTESPRRESLFRSNFHFNKNKFSEDETCASPVSTEPAHPLPRRESSWREAILRSSSKHAEDDTTTTTTTTTAAPVFAEPRRESLWRENIFRPRMKLHDDDHPPSPGSPLPHRDHHIRDESTPASPAAMDPPSRRHSYFPRSRQQSVVDGIGMESPSRRGSIFRSRAGSRDDSASLGAKISLVPVFAQTAAVSMATLVTAPFRGEHGASTYKRHVAYASLRALMGNLSLEQQKCLGAGTDEMYLGLAKSQKFTPESILVSETCRAHWVGSSSAKKVVIYYHGGGYAMPASAAHIEYIWRLLTDMKKQGHDAAILMLAYTRVPAATYPKQLIEAIALLKILIEEERRHPSDIILLGDSAGGNLALAVMSHLLHPHPSGEVPELKLSSPLAGSLLISPWGCFDHTLPGFIRNQHSDMLVAAAEDQWAAAYRGTADSDAYTEPAMAPAEWWHGLDHVVKDVFVWCGGGEVLIDGITEVAEKIKSVHRNTTFYLSPRSGHEEMIFDVLLGYEKSDSSKAVEAWLFERL